MFRYPEREQGLLVNEEVKEELKACEEKLRERQKRIESLEPATRSELKDTQEELKKEWEAFHQRRYITAMSFAGSVHIAFFFHSLVNKVNAKFAGFFTQGVLDRQTGEVSITLTNLVQGDHYEKHE